MSGHVFDWNVDGYLVSRERREFREWLAETTTPPKPLDVLLHRIRVKRMGEVPVPLDPPEFTVAEYLTCR